MESHGLQNILNTSGQGTLTLKALTQPFLGFVINPKSTEGMAKSDKLSKTAQTPLSEFIGSHIYEILGYPVHKTLLGIRKNFLVVACKDFCDEKTRLLEMRTLKNIHISEMNQKFLQHKLIC